MSVTSSLSDNGQELTIAVSGRFDFSSLQAFRGAYEQVKDRPARYIVDLAQTEFLDSSALAMLLALRDHAGGDGANIRIINCKPDAKKILVITKLDELFSVE